MSMPGSSSEPGGDVRTGATSVPASSAGRSLSLDDFVVLNDEIRAFVRAGIPLDVGLRGTVSRSEGLLQDVAARIADRTAQGQSLTEAIAAEGPALPMEYRALLSAGLRTGRLPAVLTSISELGESVSQLRRQLRLALIYPAIVSTLAVGLFVELMLFVVPQLHRTHEVLRTEESVFLRGLMLASETVAVWGIGLPVVLFGMGVLALIWRGITGGRTNSIGSLGWLPGARDIGVARFSHVLSVLVEYGVPLPDAVRLCGDASGSARLRAAAVSLAADIESGAPLVGALSNCPTLPAFLRWLIAVGEQQGSLASSLKQAAGVYEQRALARLDRMRRFVPPVIVLCVGGLITLVYALSIFVPMTELLKSLEGVPR